MKTCDHCDGDGGWEIVIPAIGKWCDPTPGGEWRVCPTCEGLGYIEGEAEPATEDELPPAVGAAEIEWFDHAW